MIQLFNFVSKLSVSGGTYLMLNEMIAFVQVNESQSYMFQDDLTLLSQVDDNACQKLE